MKGIITLCLLLNMTTGSAITSRPNGTAAVDEKYLEEDSIKTKSSSIERKTVHELEENPRNPAMVESFGQVGSKEDDQDRMEERKIHQTEKIKKGRD